MPRAKHIITITVIRMPRSWINRGSDSDYIGQSEVAVLLVSILFVFSTIHLAFWFPDTHGIMAPVLCLILHSYFLLQVVLPAKRAELVGNPFCKCGMEV